MNKVFAAHNPVEAHIVRGLLEREASMPKFVARL